MKKELTCIVCPNGCTLSVDIEDGKVTAVTGNECRRGDKYAREEVIAPKRVITAVIPVNGGITAVTSVKTSCAVPKEKINAVMTEINKIRLNAPVAIGEVAARHIAGTDADVVITRGA